MVSDIQKLHNIIDSLEEQSLRVTEFNGVLTAVNSAKDDILLAKSSFEDLAEEQKKLVAESYTRFDEYHDKLVALESKLSNLEKNVLTAENFEVGRDKILLRISELRFVTTEQFEQGTLNTEKALTSQIIQGNSKLEELIASQEKSIRSLKIFLALGMILLSSGILYLARDIFL